MLEERRIKLSVSQQQGHISRAWVTEGVEEQQEPGEPSLFQRIAAYLSPWATGSTDV